MKRYTTILAVVIACLVITGCVPKNWIVWAPDGKTAAVLSDDGLQLMQPNGKMSPVLLPNAVAVTWSPDGKQLLVSETEEVIWFDDIRKSISDKQFTEIIEVGRLVHHIPKSPDLDNTYLIVSELVDKLKLSDTARSAVALYLQDELEQKIPQGLLKKDVNIPSVRLIHYRLYDFIGAGRSGKLEPNHVMASNLFDRDTFPHPRFSPDGRSVAYLAGIDTSGQNALWVTEPVDGAAAEVIADRAVAFAWAPDSKRLAYFEPVEDSDAMVLLKTRNVRDAADALRPTGKPVDVAGLVTGNTQFLEVLPDNQILFAAPPIELPITVADFKSENRLFRLDPEQKFALEQVLEPSLGGPRFERLTAFSISPNGDRLAYVDNEGRAGVIELKTGAHTAIQTEKLEGVSIALIPAWRGNKELTVMRANPENRIGATAGQVVRWRDGATQTVLGADWPRDPFKSRLGQKTKLK
ncbi:MAG: hypothetical protein ACYTGQ_07100 [Planctomycetota bacterium]|jgi:hypothetical protein